MVFIMGGLLFFYRYEREKRLTAVQPVVSIGRVLLGGPFSLVDDQGKPVDSESLKGHFSLIYFGFTHCPDICPAELQKMETSLAMFHNKHTSDAERIQPVFISIDPKRDTPERLRAYKQRWSPSFLFLTGTTEQIRDVARKYRVYYSAPEGAAEDDYLVDHSIYFYLLDREGEVIDYLGKNLNSLEVMIRLEKAISVRAVD